LIGTYLQHRSLRLHASRPEIHITAQQDSYGLHAYAFHHWSGVQRV
jgi:hypothetical protein